MVKTPTSYAQPYLTRIPSLAGGREANEIALVLQNPMRSAVPGSVNPNTRNGKDPYYFKRQSVLMSRLVNDYPAAPTSEAVYEIGELVIYGPIAF